jgi:hypothetical protein
MAARNENNILMHYGVKKSYSETANNVVGSTTDTVLRTITTPSSGTTNYVRKSGQPYEITDITGSSYTSITDPGTEIEYRFIGIDTGSLLYTVKDTRGVVSSVDGVTLSVAEPIKLEIHMINNGNLAIAYGKTITINTDVDVGGLGFYLPQERLTASGEVVSLYLAASGSTYYGSDYKMGGGRHTPVAGSETLHYFSISDAQAALGGRTIIHVLDSERYELKNFDLGSGITLQSELGKTPSVFRSQGPDPDNDFPQDVHDGTAYFIDPVNGTDATTGGQFYAPRKFLINALHKGGSTVIAGVWKYVVLMSDGEYTVSTQIDNNALSAYPYHVIAAPGINAAIKCSTNAFGANFRSLNAGYATSFENVTIDGQGNSMNFYLHSVVSSTNPDVKNCNVKNFGGAMFGSCNNSIELDGNIIENISGIVLAWQPATASDTATIKNNLFKNNATTTLQLNSGAGNLTATIEDNIFLNNSTAVYIAFGATSTITCSYNTFYGNATAFTAFPAGVFSSTFTGLILKNNTNDFLTSGHSPSVTYSFYESIGGWTDGGNNSTSDPGFIDAANNVFALTSDSNAYKYTSTAENAGTRNNVLYFSGNSNIINGFIIESGVYATAGVTQLSTHTGHQFKWCTIQNSPGVAIDLYNGSSVTIQNCLTTGNYAGVYVKNGAVTIDESIFSDINKNVQSDGSIINITNSVFYRAMYLLYLGTVAYYATIKDSVFAGAAIESIFLENSSKGAYSIDITYCCINSLLDSSITLDSTSITDNPLFVDITTGSEDFHIRTKKNGFLFNSPCFQAGENGVDMGAYSVTYAISDYSWLKYQFEENPLQNEMNNQIKGNSSFTSITGGHFLYGDYHKKIFPMRFSNYTTKSQRDKIAYLNSFYPTRENELTRDETIIRYHLLPKDYLIASTGTLNHSSYWDETDYTVKIEDTTKSWTENEWRDWSVGVKFKKVLSATIDASAKTITKSGAFTGEDWTEYYVYIDNNYYIIASNTNDALTVIDTLGTLKSETADVSVEKYFEILSNGTDYIYIEDLENELLSLDGSYDYYIDFMNTVVNVDLQQYRQNRFSWNEERTKSNYSLTVEKS